MRSAAGPEAPLPDPTTDDALRGGGGGAAIARAWPTLKPVLAVAIPLLLLAVVWHELRGLDYVAIRADVASAHRGWLVLAVLASALAVTVMGLYDTLAFPGTPTLGWRRRWLLGSAVFGWTNLISLGPVGGPVVRMFLYRRHGMTPAQLSRGFAAHYAGMMGGMAGWLAAAWGAWWAGARVGTWLLLPLALALTVAFTWTAGWVAVRVTAKHTWARGMDRARFGWLGVVSFLDWGLTVAAFVLAARAVGLDLPSVDAGRVVLSGYAVGIVSMVPGGLGTADAVWLKLLTLGGYGASTVSAALVLFRASFYLVPWAMSVALFYTVFTRGSERAERWQRRTLAGALGVNAGLMLVSAATPGIQARLDAVGEALPLPVIEASHALTVVAALLLLVLLRGVIRGYRAAWGWSVVLLAASLAGHLLKGFDAEEAALAGVLLAVLLTARRTFTRPGRVPIGWHLTLSVALGAAAFFVVAGVAAFAHVPYRPELWARFAVDAEASRFLRAVPVVGLLGLALVLRQALRPVNPWVVPTPDDVAEAEAFTREHAYEGAEGLTAGVGDKGVWWWRPDGDATPPRGMALYQRRGDAWVVYADPVLLPGADAAALVAALNEQARDDDLDLVFYQLSAAWLEPLHEVGFSVLKLGEEASVDLAAFTLAGGKASGYRRTLRDVEKAGVTYAWCDAPHPPELIDACRGISAGWLAAKGAAEMQFSLGYFSAAYLQRGPLAVARDASGAVVAFVNVLATRAGGPATLDFIRYRSGGVDNLMDFVLLRTMERLKADGYARFSLGMAPMSDVGAYRSSRPTERLMAAFARRAERFYNYSGLLHYKQKFHPAWTPRYLAFRSPWGGVGAITTCAALVKGLRSSDRARIAAARDASS